MLDYPLPNLREIVGAIDAHDPHTSFDQPSNQIRVVGCFSGHRDHDPGFAPSRSRSQDCIRVLSEQRCAGIERDRRILDDIRGDGLAAQRVECLQHSLERGHHVRLHAPQGAESKARELVLKLTHVMAPYGEVVDEVEGALAHRRCDQLELGAKLLFGGKSSAPQLLDTAVRSPEPNRPGNLPFRSLPSSHRGPSFTSLEQQCVS
jgi:hypothetical protein